MKTEDNHRAKYQNTTPLVEQLGASDWETRNAAFLKLSELGSSVVEALIAGTNHPNWRVRRGCADLMDHLADDRCTESLLRLLRDPVEAVRRLAIHALGCQGCKVCPLKGDTVAPLVECAMADSSIRVRRVAVHLLGCQPPDSRIHNALETILENDTDTKIRSRAQWAVSKYHTASA
jgi:HEAT repeat protein